MGSSRNGQLLTQPTLPPTAKNAKSQSQAGPAWSAGQTATVATYNIQFHNKYY